MALKALLLKKRIDNKRKALNELLKKREAHAAREAELARSIDEVENEEQRAEVEGLVTEFETERDANEQAITNLEGEIEGLERDLAAEEAQQATDPAPAPAPAQPEPQINTDPQTSAETERRNEAMSRRNNVTMTFRDRVAGIVTREEVTNYLGEIRSAIREKRAITNVGLTIPQVMLGVLRENVAAYSRLYRHVSVGHIGGEANLTIVNNNNEAVWTECCGALNELTLGFYEESFGCWKLGGFFVICNASLEDSDLDLAQEILTALAKSIAFSDDKTILYGTGNNMPMGIVTRLAQESKPAGYSQTARPWVDLHETNIITISKQNTYGLTLFQQLQLAASKAKGSYARGEKVWAMNETTYGKVIAAAMSIDASGAIVSGVNGTMPVIGGVIEILPDSVMPDDNIVMGYFDLYQMVERAGEKYASSEHLFFLQDKTVYKGIVRWDGKPVIAEAFVLIGIDGTEPTTSVTFKADGANVPTSVWLPATAEVPVGATLALNAVLTPYGVSSALTWTSGTPAKATVADGVVTGVAAGTSVITVATENDLTAQCTVSVVADT